MPQYQIGGHVEVLVEAPKWSFIKPDTEGGIDLVSPIPCPYNYGCLPGTISGDGDPIDALILGSSLPRGHRARVEVRAVVHFVDNGDLDPKLVCSTAPLTAFDFARLTIFFESYARLKGVVWTLRGDVRGRTFLDRIERHA